MAMSGLELLTAVRERLPIVVLVFNDGQLNRIRLQQLSQFGQPVAVELLNPDFEGLAHSARRRYERIGRRGGSVRPGPRRGEVTVSSSSWGTLRLLRERAKGLARGPRVERWGREACGGWSAAFCAGAPKPPLYARPGRSIRPGAAQSLVEEGAEAHGTPAFR